ncbi:uncharacterized protein LOC133517122 [Cydia pomonella]|uniref:uncharacterized protein LOC133517122 n=1 Tax=Cydia pomonella TaxID=82600 RepID=UPI002ADE2B69|nr:uncharacterized protein LOC133517122 [Cydia pomonella]
MPTSWIYHLKKPELIQQAESRNIQTTDLTFEQIRKLLVESIKSTEDFQTPEKERPAKMSEDEGKVDANRLTKLIREWSVSFKGYGKPEEFLERLQELITASGIEKEDILPALPRILQGKALAWYRNNVESFKDWDSFLSLFKLYYYPSNYEEDLIVKIAARKQRFGESFVDYVTDLQTLMRRYGNLTEKEKLHRIHENMSKNYKLYIKKTDFKDLTDLVKLAADYESILTPVYSWRQVTQGTEELPEGCSYHEQGDEILETSQQCTSARDRQHWQQGSGAGQGASERTKIHPNYDPKICCWSCGRPGHDTAQCRSRQRIFCSTCGTLGILSKNCCKRNNGRARSQPVGAAGDQNNDDNRPFIHVPINGITYRCLIDTGSTHTYVNEEVYKECKKKGNPERKVQHKIILANGAKTTVWTAVRAEIKVKQVRTEHWVRVLPMASTVIIGMDLLSKIGVKITFPDAQEDKSDHRDETQVSVPDQGSTHPDTSNADLQTVTDRSSKLPQTPTSTEKLQLEELRKTESAKCNNSPKGNTEVQQTNNIKHNKPVKHKYYPGNPKQQLIKSQHVKDRRPQNIINKSSNPCNQIADEPSKNPVYASRTQAWYERKLDQVQKEANTSQEYRAEGRQLYKKITNSRYNTRTDPDTDWKLCVPESERLQVVKQHHNTPRAGHPGITKTTKKIMQRYYWPGMQRDIYTYVRKCNACQKQKATQQKTSGTMNGPISCTIPTRTKNRPAPMICWRHTEQTVPWYNINKTQIATNYFKQI